MSRVDEALRRAGRGPESTSQEGADDRDPPAFDRLELRRAWPSEDALNETPALRTELAAAHLASAAVSVGPAAAAPAVEDPPEPAPSPLLAELSVDELGEGLARKVVVDRDMMPASREQYRRLAATLHQMQATNGLKVVMVVSAAAGEGKTLTAANLALTFSESYHRKVLLIDGDLRRPSLDTLFKIDGSPGLHEGLTSPVEQILPLRPVTPRLMVLPAGEATPDPIAGLTGERMRRLVDEARAAFDWVVIDTPPVGLLPDANLLAGMADGAVLVVRAEATHYDLVQRAVEALGRERILGVVLNRAPEIESSYSAYYNYSRYYAARTAGGAARQ